jgi:uncharacterized protein (TIGR02270 family)
MALSEEDFLIELYQEHLEEASFLYEQRQTLFNDADIVWPDIDDFEQRLEAHIDALVLGAELALQPCRQRAVEGEPGELFIAVCVFCRQGRKDLVLEVLAGLDPEDGERLEAISDALKYEMPDQWSDEFIRRVTENRPNASHMLAKLAGYRRLPAGAGPELLKILSGKVPQNTPDILCALGRLRYQEARPMLVTKYLKSQNESVCINAVRALLRMGEKEALNHCVQSVQSQDWPNTLIGISAGWSAVSILLKKASQGKAATNRLLGLGLLGDISAVETLIGRLADPETAESAALAINLITGAEIYENAFIPDKFDEDELFPEELEKFRQGQAPTKSDGTPYGVAITRLSQKPEDWQDWWAKNRSGFKDGIRYRNGKPFSPACLLENMEFEKSPFKIRQLAYEELVIRYGMDIPFEANMYVAQQKRVIKDIAQWVAANSARFQEGVWYFAGRIMS